MLVLTRKLGEGLVVGQDIRLKVLEIHKNQVKIGIEAPSNVRIYRNEVYEQIKEENLKASTTQLDILQTMIGNRGVMVSKKETEELHKA